MTKECIKLKDYFQNDLGYEWHAYMDAFDEILQTKKPKSPELTTMMKKQTRDKITKLQTATGEAFTNTPSGQKVKYKIKQTDSIEGGEWSDTKKAVLSIRKSRKFGSDIVMVGDVLKAGAGIIVTAGVENIVSTDENPILYTVIGFEVGTKQLVASYEGKVLLGLRTATKNVIINEVEIIKMLSK